MKNFRFKAIRRYKKVENFLKNHPFWPSFLSNGGILFILLILSVIFTILCGKNSVRDIAPELKVIDLSFDGKHSTWLDQITILHDIEKDSKEFVDRFYVSYGSTDDLDVSSTFDASNVYRKIADYGVSIDKETTIISKMRFLVYNESALVSTKNNIIFDENASFDECIALPDTVSPLLYTQHLLCCKDSLRKKTFEEAFDGNLIASNRKNPYIYFNFLLNGSFLLDSEESKLVFIFAEKDNHYHQTLNPVNILQVFPEPTYQSPSSIIYQGEDLAKVIKNNGFTFLGEDLSIKQRSDKSIFLWTVLFGTSIAITIDILVNLILKWRNIIPKRRKRD